MTTEGLVVLAGLIRHKSAVADCRSGAIGFVVHGAVAVGAGAHLSRADGHAFPTLAGLGHVRAVGGGGALWRRRWILSRARADGVIVPFVALHRAGGNLERLPFVADRDLLLALTLLGLLASLLAATLLGIDRHSAEGEQTAEGRAGQKTERTTAGR